jgi:hypothetical protein
VLLGAATAPLVLTGMASENRRVFRHAVALEPAQSQTEPLVYFSDPFALVGRQNIQLAATGSVDNSWMYVQGDLYNLDTGLVLQFDLPIEYYHGYDDGHWSEGSKRRTRYLSAVPAGTYTLRLSVERSDFRKPGTLEIAVTQGVLQPFAWVFLFLGISFLPLGVAFHHLVFERRRWSRSDYAHGLIHVDLSGDDD